MAECYCNANTYRYWCNCHTYVYATVCTCQTACTCNTVISCTCNCNYDCTCNCNNCTVNQTTSQTLPWDTSTQTTGVTVGSLIDDTHLTQFYTAINAERTRRGQAAFTWSYYSVAGNITANQWNEMVTKMNTWLTFTLAHTAGTNITSANIVNLRSNMITIAAQCYCNCNRTCSCNTVVACSCQANRVCTCNTVCSCNCAYTCTCNCQYRWYQSPNYGTGVATGATCSPHVTICTCHSHSDINLKKNVEYM